MKFTDAEIVEITVIMVAHRLSDSSHAFISSLEKMIGRLKELKTQGEVTGTKFNRVLKANGDAYRYITSGFTERRIPEYLSPLKVGLEGFSLSHKFANEYDQIIKTFNKKVRQIEEKYPRAPNHLKNRLIEIRALSIELVDEIVGFVSMFYMEFRQYQA